MRVLMPSDRALGFGKEGIVEAIKNIEAEIFHVAEGIQGADTAK